MHRLNDNILVESVGSIFSGFRIRFRLVSASFSKTELERISEPQSKGAFRIHTYALNVEATLHRRAASRAKDESPEAAASVIVCVLDVVPQRAVFGFSRV